MRGLDARDGRVRSRYRGRLRLTLRLAWWLEVGHRLGPAVLPGRGVVRARREFLRREGSEVEVPVAEDASDASFPPPVLVVPGDAAELAGAAREPRARPPQVRDERRRGHGLDLVHRLRVVIPREVEVRVNAPVFDGCFVVRGRGFHLGGVAAEVDLLTFLSSARLRVGSLGCAVPEVRFEAAGPPVLGDAAELGGASGGDGPGRFVGARGWFRG